jgi:hypothetical protein
MTDYPCYIMVDYDNRCTTEHATLDDVYESYDACDPSDFIRAMYAGDIEVYEVKRRVSTPTVTLQWS